MKTYTTKEAAKMVRRELGDRARQRELVVIENVSGTFQIEATSDEIDDFERFSDSAIDSDTISDELAEKLLNNFRSEGLLEAQVAQTR